MPPPITTPPIMMKGSSRARANWRMKLPGEFLSGVGLGDAIEVLASDAEGSEHRVFHEKHERLGENSRSEGDEDHCAKRDLLAPRNHRRDWIHRFAHPHCRHQPEVV